MNMNLQAGANLTAWGGIDGKEIVKIELTNNKGTRLVVSNFGATAISLFCVDKDGKHGDILLGYDTLDEYHRDEMYMGSVVGRYANRIAGGEVVIDGQKYTLNTRPGGFHLHGGDIGFNKRVFDYRIIPGDGEHAVVFSYISNHMEEGFPGEVAVEVIYTLKDDNSWVVDYRAETDRTTIINLTQHAYFNLSSGKASHILDHQLRINSPYYLPVTPLQVPNGEIAEVRDSPFDFIDARTIGEHIDSDDQQLVLSRGYDHSWVLEREHTPVLKHAAVVTEPMSGRKLDVYTTEPAVHFYSGNFLSGNAGKNNAVYNKRAGFCLETQHFPDAPNHPHFPGTVLRPGEKFTSQTVFQVSVSR